MILQGAFVIIPNLQMIKLRFERIRDQPMINNQEVSGSEHKTKFCPKNSRMIWPTSQSSRDNGGTSLVVHWLKIRLPTFEPWSGNIPHAAEQLSPCATTTEPAL